ncbi:MAG: DUF2935 domain-containing protein [Clostridiaceae bacterium]|nr:DUF2935 domain-containing protein [Clostridiaceae bacterium]
MYCNTTINQFLCVFNEIQLWSRISSEHPDFLKTLANLSNVNLPKTTDYKLYDFHKRFLDLYKNNVHVYKVANSSPNLNAQHLLAVERVIEQFILVDTEVIAFYSQLTEFGTENRAWQKLVEHVISEQAFMLELFIDLKKQIR